MRMSKLVAAGIMVVASAPAISFASNWVSQGSATATLVVEGGYGIEVVAKTSGEKVTTSIKDGAKLAGFTIKNTGTTSLAPYGSRLSVDSANLLSDTGSTGVFVMTGSGSDQIKVKFATGGGKWSAFAKDNRYVFDHALVANGVSDELAVIAAGGQIAHAGTYSLNVTGAYEEY